MNVLSLFSGIGGLELGLERAGMTVVGQVELDEYCRRVLAKHWPEVPRHDDVRTAVDWWQSEPRPTVDVICGGFPCQDISNAGRRVGIRGERSGLWSFMADAVRVLRPRYVVMENVSAILVRGLDVVAGDLAEVGYDIQWDCIPAAAVGAPHRRDRWWGLAYPSRVNGEWPVSQGDSRGRPLRSIGNGGGGAGELAHAAGERCGQRWPGGSDSSGSHGEAEWTQALADADDVAWATELPRRMFSHPPSPRRVGGADGRSRTSGDHWAAEPDVGRVAHGVRSRVDRLRALGNAVVPQVAEHVGRLLMDFDQERAA